MSIGTIQHPRPPPDYLGLAGARMPPVPFSEEGAFEPHELERMAHASLEGVEPLFGLIDRWRQAGHGLEAIYLRAIAPTARLLGHWWRCDVADFAQVTIGSSNLHRLMQGLSQEFCAPGTDQPTGLSLLLATEPRAQHTLGSFMQGEFFRRRGWAVHWLHPQDAEDVLTHLRRDWFDAVGLSMSTARHLQTLVALVPRLRAESPNPRLCILAGGPLALTDPAALDTLGADVLASDALETVNQLGHLVFARRS